MERAAPSLRGAAPVIATARRFVQPKYLDWMAEIEPGITNNTDESRYEIRLGDELVGHAEYTLNDGLITFTHTGIDPAHEGKGLASKLVRFALDDVRAQLASVTFEEAKEKAAAALNGDFYKPAE